jgi:hypothetical protein
MQEQSAKTRMEASAAPKNELDAELKKVALDEYGLPVLPTGDAQKDKEITELLKIVEQEKSHGQWKKQGLNLVSLICLLLQSLLRGSTSDIGFKKCSTADWVFLAFFFMVMLSFVVIAVKLVSKE